MRQVGAFGRWVSVGVVAACGLAMAGATPTALARQSEAGAEDPLVFDMQFPGGELGTFFDSLAQIGKANIVAPTDVRRLPMPEIQLRGVTAWSAMQMVGVMFERSAHGSVIVSDVVPGDSAPIYVVRLLVEGPGPERPVVHEVFSVADVLRPANEEAVESQVRKIFEMIESAMSLAPGEAEPELAYHDDSQMLVFRGTPEQRRLVESVLARYLGSWRPQSAEARSLRDEIAELELKAREATIEAESAGVRLEFLRRVASETQALVAAGGVNSRELAESQAHVSDQDARMRAALARADYVHARLEELRSRLAALTPGEGASVVVYDIQDLGEWGLRVVRAYQEFVNAANLVRTRVEIDGDRAVVVQAGPPLQEALRIVLSALREQLKDGHAVPTNGGR